MSGYLFVNLKKKGRGLYCIRDIINIFQVSDDFNGNTENFDRESFSLRACRCCGLSKCQWWCTTRGKFKNASALGRSLYWCQALHIMNKDRYQSTSARRALTLLNSPPFQIISLIDGQKLIRAYVSLFYCHAVLK